MTQRRKADRPVNRLLDIVVEEVSLVDRAANEHRFLIVKRDTPMADTQTDTDAAEEAGDLNDQADVEETGAAPEDAPNSNADPLLTTAVAALEGLTSTVELLGSLGADAADARLAPLAAELKATAEALLARAGGAPSEASAEAGDAADDDAPESLRAMTRSVAREDFEINARRLPGVARALMLTSNEDPSVDENAGVLYVIPQGGGVPTPALKNLVLKQVTEVYPCTLTFQVSVLDPVYRRLDVAARVFLRAGVSGTTVRARIVESLVAYFRVTEPDGTPNRRVDFGFNLKDAEGNPVGEIAWSDVFNVIRDTEGVRKIGDAPGDLTLNGLPADVRLRVQEFPVLGTVTLTNGDTGGPL